MITSAPGATSRTRHVRPGAESTLKATPAHPPARQGARRHQRPDRSAGPVSAHSNGVIVLGAAPQTRTGVNVNPPGVGAYWTSSLRGHNQVIVADGTNNSTNGRILMTTWTWTSAGWIKGGGWWAWDGANGWDKTARAT
jgi:hypothetical protein